MEGFLNNYFTLIGVITIVVGVIYTLTAFSVKWILQNHGFKVTYLIAQYFYEYEMLRTIENKNKNYSIIRKIYFVLNWLFLFLIGFFMVLIFIN